MSIICQNGSMALEAKKRSALNGVDCLMLAFDHQLKKNGFTGNIAQIILELREHLPVSVLRQRLKQLMIDLPILRAPLVQRFWKGNPFWSFTALSAADAGQSVFVHDLAERPFGKGAAAARDKCRKEIFNTPLRIDKGEWVRFDLIYLAGGLTELIMTWHHILMDAHGAEYFLHVLGRDDAASAVGLSAMGAPMQRRLSQTGMKEKWRLAGRALHLIDAMADNCPLSLYTALQSTTLSRLDYRLRDFSLGETEIILKRCRESGGVLNSSAYFMANSLLAFDHLHQDKRVETGSYVVSFPVDLRKIGTRLPVFSNQAGTLLYSFKKGDMANFYSVMRSFREQTQTAVRRDILFANLCTMELSRCLPSWLYARKIRQSLNGEIASLVFANPGRTFEGLTRFMGRTVTRQYHVPTVIVPPGIGVMFYTFSDRLLMTLVFVEGLLTAEEADAFLLDISGRLMGKG